MVTAVGLRRSGKAGVQSQSNRTCNRCITRNVVSTSDTVQLTAIIIRSRARVDDLGAAGPCNLRMSVVDKLSSECINGTDSCWSIYAHRKTIRRQTFELAVAKYIYFLNTISMWDNAQEAIRQCFFSVGTISKCREIGSLKLHRLWLTLVRDRNSGNFGF